MTLVTISFSLSRFCLCRKIVGDPKPNGIYWYGVSDIDVEGDWKNIDGSNANHTDLLWLSGNPNNVDNNQDCIMFEEKANLLSDDGFCSEMRYGICEIPICSDNK